ncbi:helix-turn-helix domain-containing protein [Paenibacillus sp. MSJ-34]|nr:helix-turn-helix domain-containing protein [Paenibacillus sp. MSJ-34]
MFQNYPDVVNVTQMCEMLGGISTKTAYKLLQANQIEHFKIGRAYKIPKINILLYLLRMTKDHAPSYCNALVH